MEEVSFAIAGAGLIGRRHVEAIGRARGARVSAIVDPAPEAAEYAAAQGLRHFGSLEAAFAVRACDAVFLATPNRLHVEGALACIGAGLPVLVEKPLDVDPAAARRLVEAGEAAGVPVLTGHHRRHNPLIEAAKVALEAGEIGRIVSVHAMFWLMKPDEYFDVPWRRQAGAGPVFVNLIHDLDLMRHLVGEVAAVQAARSNMVRRNPVEESCVIALEFRNGALGTANLSDTVVAPWSWELTAGENPAYPATQESCYQIGGTQGALDLPAGRIWFHPRKRSWWEPIAARIAPRPAGDPLVRQAEQFARVVRDGEAPLVSGREGLKTLELIDAVRRAAETGRRVVL